MTDDLSTVADGAEASPATADCLLKGTIATSRFSIGPNVHARQAILRRAAKFWMAVALPVGILVVCGLAYDTRLLFVAAAVIFILFPSLLMIGWYGILTRPWAVASIFPQVVTLGPDNELTVEYHPMPGQDAAAAVPDDLVIPREEVGDCQLWGRNIIVVYGNGRELVVPISAFAGPDQASSFIRRLESSRYGED